MYKGFRVENISRENNSDFYLRKGYDLYNDYKDIVRSSLTEFLNTDNSLDGSEIINQWFPQINAHIFISHSHKDETLAITLAGWLYETFGIISFIDSCIWGCSNDLIKLLDNKHSWLYKEQNIYSYEKVLDSTSHVHMMLSTALSSMIDKTECLFFLDTPNSLESFEKKDKTESPWIYSEIAFSQIVRITIPERIKREIEKKEMYFEKSMSEGIHGLEKLSIKYDLYSNHLTRIDYTTLNRWEAYKINLPEFALDKLYEISLIQTNGMQVSYLQ